MKDDVRDDFSGTSVNKGVLKKNSEGWTKMTIQRISVRLSKKTILVKLFYIQIQLTALSEKQGMKLGVCRQESRSLQAVKSEFT